MSTDSYKLKGDIVSKIYDSICEGLTDVQIAKKYNIDHSTVYYYRKKEFNLRHNLGPVREKKIIKPVSKKVHHIFTPTMPKLKKIHESKRDLEDHEPKHTTKTYMEIQQEEEDKRLSRISHCDHVHWIRRCSSCGVILESDAQVNEHYFNKEKPHVKEIIL